MFSRIKAAAARRRREVVRALVSGGLLLLPCMAALSMPLLSGTPATSVTAAHYYSFQPGVSGTTAKLMYSITNKPSWATFDITSGHLYGTPAQPTNVGSYGNISIRATDGSATAYFPPFSISVLALPNTPPKISGSASVVATVGKEYSFRPTATDPNGLKLSFVITNKPAWVAFDAATGTLSGTPTASNIGTYSNIAIAASDGYLNAFLPSFSVVVQNSTTTVTSTPPPVVVSAPPAGKTGAATLSWLPPTQTTGGSVLTNLAGYRIYFGTTPTNLQQALVVSNPGITRYVIGGLTGSTWYFQMTAFDRNGMESPPTSVESFTLQ